MVIHREIGWREFWDVSVTSMYLTAQIFLIVAVAGVFSWLLTTNGVPKAAVDIIAHLDLQPWQVLLTINVFLLIVGCFIDTASAILVLTPLLLPIALAIGVDPIHFGIIVTVNLSIGTFTPPFGINIFVAQSIFDVPLAQHLCRTGPVHCRRDRRADDPDLCAGAVAVAGPADRITRKTGHCLFK